MPVVFAENHFVYYGFPIILLEHRLNKMYTPPV